METMTDRRGEGTGAEAAGKPVGAVGRQGVTAGAGLLPAPAEVRAANSPRVERRSVVGAQEWLLDLADLVSKAELIAANAHPEIREPLGIGQFLQSRDQVIRLRTLVGIIERRLA